MPSLIKFSTYLGKIKAWLNSRHSIYPIMILPLVIAGLSFSITVLAEGNLRIPHQSDWTDYGRIIEAGAQGDWDEKLFGGFAATAIKKNGTYFLYYQGAKGYRVEDDTVTWRAIGVATSKDGINFTKSPDNPVITWHPNENGEEGAVSCGGTLAYTGQIVLYYGANTEETATTINADARLAISSNGVNFTDLGVVLKHRNSFVWGSGDELFPIIGFHDAGKWFVYYIPNGTVQRRKLGVAWGSSHDRLTNTAMARDREGAIRVWGTGGSAKVGPQTYALFLNDVTKPRIEVRIVSLNSPNQLTAPLATYQFKNVRQATVLLDHDTNTWFMYYRNFDQSCYGVKLAPAADPDRSPPSIPFSLKAKLVSNSQIDLSWSPSSDQETGVASYKIFRNGRYIATVTGNHYSDTDLMKRTEYMYEVSAINYHGVEGSRSSAVGASNLASRKPHRDVHE